MTTVELEFDKPTLERARYMAVLRDSTLETLIREIIYSLAITDTTADPFLGMFAQEPELIDQVVESTMLTREAASLRLLDG